MLIFHEVGITSATDKVPEVKVLMDQAREFIKNDEFDKTEEVYNKILDIGEKKIQENLSGVPGAKITLNRTKGSFNGYTEPTFSGTLEVSPENKKAAVAAISKSGEDLGQDSVNISQVKNELGPDEQYETENEEGIVLEPNIDLVFDEPITSQQYKEINEIAKDLAGFTLRPDKKGITLYNNSKFTPFGLHLLSNSMKKLKNSKKPLTQEEFDSMLIKVFGASRVSVRKDLDPAEATNKYEVTFHKLPPKE